MTEYGILLVAVRCPDRRQGEDSNPGQSKLRVNPGNKVVIQNGHVGIFIAQGPTEVQRSVPRRKK